MKSLEEVIAPLIVTETGTGKIPPDTGKCQIEFDVDGCLADLSDLWVSFAKKSQSGDGYTREYFRGAMNLTETVMECIKKHRREKPRGEWRQGSLIEYWGNL